MYLWASALWGLLAAWLWRTESPTARGEGWTKVKRLLWAEWLIQGLRWLVAIGLFNLGLLTALAWTRWLGLAFDYGSVVFGPDSDWVVFVPLGVGLGAVAAVSVAAFRRGWRSSQSGSNHN